LSLIIGRFEIYNSDYLGHHSIGLRVLRGDDEGLVVSYPIEKIEQLFDFLYNETWNDEKPKH